MGDYSNLEQSGVADNYTAGHYLYREGEAPRSIYLVEQGRIQLVATSLEGKEFIMHIIKPGRLFGVVEMLLQTEYQHDAVAMEDSRVRTISAEEWNHIVEQSPQLKDALMYDLAKSLQVMSKRVKEISLSSTRRRLALYLYKKIRPSSHQEHKKSLTLEFSRETLASIFNTSREHISRELSALARTGAITIHNRTIIINSADDLRQFMEP